MRKIHAFFWYQNFRKFEKDLKWSDRAPLISGASGHDSSRFPLTITPRDIGGSMGAESGDYYVLLNFFVFLRILISTTYCPLLSCLVFTCDLLSNYGTGHIMDSRNVYSHIDKYPVSYPFGRNQLYRQIMVNDNYMEQYFLQYVKYMLCGRSVT